MAVELSSKCFDDVTQESFCFGDVTLFSLIFGLELENTQTQYPNRNIFDAFFLFDLCESPLSIGVIRIGLKNMTEFHPISHLDELRGLSVSGCAICDISFEV